MAQSQTETDGGQDSTDELTENGILTSEVDLVEMVEHHGKPVAVTENSIVFRDDAGHELNEFVRSMDVDRAALSSEMHDLARELHDADSAGDPWSVADPVVLDRESFDEDILGLEVAPDTVIEGLKRNSEAGERRKILFKHQIGGGYGRGALRDVRGLMWDGEAPPQFRPEAFIREPLPDFLETMAEGRQWAEEEGEDPEWGAEIAVEEWESQARAWLQDWFVIEPVGPEFERTIVLVDYVEA